MKFHRQVQFPRIFRLKKKMKKKKILLNKRNKYISKKEKYLKIFVIKSHTYRGNYFFSHSSNELEPGFEPTTFPTSCPSCPFLRCTFSCRHSLRQI